MKQETGSPAFENINELLSEKIITHSRKHLSTRKNEQTIPPPSFLPPKRLHRIGIIILIVVTIIGVISIELASRGKRAGR